MSDPKALALREAEFLLYQTEDGRTRVEVRFGGETAWLSLTQMADLFQRDKSVISRHIKNVFEEGELTRAEPLQNLQRFSARKNGGSRDRSSTTTSTSSSPSATA